MSVSVKMYASELVSDPSGNPVTKWGPQIEGACEISSAVQTLHNPNKFCIQFAKEFNLDDLSQNIWPICLGLYPPGSIVYSESALGEAQPRIDEATIAKLKQQLEGLEDMKKQVRGWRAE